MTIFVNFADIAAIALVGFLLAVLFISYLWEKLRRKLCSHPREAVFENRACQAVCRKCGKNLGYIGDYREAQWKDKP